MVASELIKEVSQRRGAMNIRKNRFSTIGIPILIVSSLIAVGAIFTKISPEPVLPGSVKFYESGRINTYNWLANGDMIVTSDEHNGQNRKPYFLRVDAKTQKNTPLLEFEALIDKGKMPKQLSDFCFSPDGRWALQMRTDRVKETNQIGINVHKHDQSLHFLPEPILRKKTPVRLLALDGKQAFDTTLMHYAASVWSQDSSTIFQQSFPRIQGKKLVSGEVFSTVASRLETSKNLSTTMLEPAERLVAVDDSGAPVFEVSKRVNAFPQTWKLNLIARSPSSLNPVHSAKFDFSSYVAAKDQFDEPIHSVSPDGKKVIVLQHIEVRHWWNSLNIRGWSSVDVKAVLTLISSNRTEPKKLGSYLVHDFHGEDEVRWLPDGHSISYWRDDAIYVLKVD